MPDGGQPYLTPDEIRSLLVDHKVPVEELLDGLSREEIMPAFRVMDELGIQTPRMGGPIMPPGVAGGLSRLMAPARSLGSKVLSRLPQLGPKQPSLAQLLKQATQKPPAAATRTSTQMTSQPPQGVANWRVERPITTTTQHPTAPLPKPAAGTPKNMQRMDPNEFNVPTDMKVRPSMGPKGPGGVQVEGEGITKMIQSLLAAIGMGGAGAAATPQRRRVE